MFGCNTWNTYQKSKKIPTSRPRMTTTQLGLFQPDENGRYFIRSSFDMRNRLRGRHSWRWDGRSDGAFCPSLLNSSVSRAALIVETSRAAGLHMARIDVELVHLVS